MAASREVGELRSTSQETYRRLKLFSPRGRRAAAGPLLPRGRHRPLVRARARGFLRAAQMAKPEVWASRASSVQRFSKEQFDASSIWSRGDPFDRPRRRLRQQFVAADCLRRWCRDNWRRRQGRRHRRDDGPGRQRRSFHQHRPPRISSQSGHEQLLLGYRNDACPHRSIPAPWLQSKISANLLLRLR